MFVLRCTQKPLDRLNATPDSDPAPADTVLGDWYANLIRVGRIQVVLAVSERSLLPVVVPARDGRALVQRLCEVLEPMFTAIGVPADDATAECGAMQHWTVGKTANRRVLGSLNDLAFQLQVGLLDFPDRTPLAQSLWLAKTQETRGSPPDHLGSSVCLVSNPPDDRLILSCLKNPEIGIDAAGDSDSFWTNMRP